MNREIDKADASPADAGAPLELEDSILDAANAGATLAAPTTDAEGKGIRVRMFSIVDRTQASPGA